MTDDDQKWPARDEKVAAAPVLPEPEDDPDAAARVRRVYRKLIRNAPGWDVVERAHAPFAFRTKGRVPAFGPKGRRPNLSNLEAFAPPPQSWDWRQHIKMAPPMDQGKCNSCTAFAMAATLTDLATIKFGYLCASLSPGHLHCCVGGAACGTALDPMSLANLAAQHPIALWQPGDFPYNPANCPTAKGQGRVGSVQYIYTPDQAFQALQHGPLLAVIDLYDDFWSNYGGQVYHHSAGIKNAAHSVELIGYDLTGQYWIIKNSEGAGWGAAGFGRIAFGECRLLTPGGHTALQLQLA